MTNTKSVVFLYSGQGSQYFHMGRDLYQANTQFRSHVDRLDQLAHERLGVSVTSIIFDESKSKGDRFDHPSYTCVGIFIMERAISLLLNDMGIYPDYVLGSSMGMYAAACQSDCIDEETAINLLLDQSEVFTSSGSAGTMIAILDSPNNINNHPVLARHTEIAAINFKSHYVVAVQAGDFETVIEYLEKNEMLYQEISVSFPYHSRWIDSVESPYIQRFENYTYNSPKTPLICCAQKGPLTEIDAVKFWNTARLPIEFPKTIQYLESQGSHTYIDVGPSGTLSVFLKRLLPSAAESTYCSVLTPYENAVANLQAIMEKSSLSTASSNI